MPIAALQFPDFDPVLVQHRSVRASAGTRWPISAEFCWAGSMRARIIRTERLWGGPAPLTVTEFDDYVVWVTLGIILGGRLGYVPFTTRPISRRIRWKSCRCGRAACRFMAALPDACWRWCCSHAAAENFDPVAGRHYLCRWTDRTVPGSAREFHQWRIVGPANRRAVGVRVSRRRPAAAPSEPAL